MRTSPNQFEVIVDFMERHGDLNKPGDGSSCQSRLQTIQKWNTLARTLNNDTSGDSKSVEKWKKVWSDYKNNTKRKANKIKQAIKKSQLPGYAGTEPATRLILSDLEKRVMRLLKSHNTGANDVFVESAVTTSTSERTLPRTTRDDIIKLKIVKIESVDGESNRAPEQVDHYEEIEALEETESVEERSSPCHQSYVGPSPTIPIHRVFPGPSTQHRKLQQRPRPARVLPYASLFTANDERWRTVFSKFAPNHMKQRDQELDLRNRELELRNKELKLRERELEQKAQDQAQWQMLFAKCIDCIDKFLNK